MNVSTQQRRNYYYRFEICENVGYRFSIVMSDRHRNNDRVQRVIIRVA